MTENRSKSKHSKHWDFILMDFIILEGSFLLAYYLRFEAVRNGEFVYPTLYRHQALILLLALVASLVFGNPYKNVLKRGRYEEVRRLGYHTGKMMLVNIISLYFIHEAGAMSRWFIIFNWTLYFCIELMFRFVWKRFLRRRLKDPSGKKATAVLVDSLNAETLVRNLGRDPFKDFFIQAVFLVNFDATTAERLRALGIAIVDNSDQLIDYVNHNWIDDVIIDKMNSGYIIDEIREPLEQMRIPVKSIIAKLDDHQGEHNRVSISRMSDYVMACHTPRVIPGSQRMAKRAMDIVGGLIGCIFTALVFVFVAPMIYMKSPGPIFFAQKRIGKNGKIFKMYKFRSMYMDAEERKAELMKQNKIQDGMMFKMDDDPRIIGSEKKDKDGNPKGIGNFIRRTSLDEFPQFYNVLKGDMSLVGTRPPTMDEWEKYTPKHRARMSIRPGITGLWQISGRSNITDFDEVVALDTEYIETWTNALDIRILFKTVFAVFNSEGAE